MSCDKWCGHSEITSKYTLVKYSLNDQDLLMRVQTWMCPECGMHGADTEIIKPDVRQKRE